MYWKKHNYRQINQIGKWINKKYLDKYIRM